MRIIDRLTSTKTIFYFNDKIKTKYHAFIISIIFITFMTLFADSAVYWSAWTGNRNRKKNTKQFDSLPGDIVELEYKYLRIQLRIYITSSSSKRIQLQSINKY